MMWTCVDFQIEPWNVILIKQYTWVVVGLGNGASWKLLFINIPTHLFIYNKTPKFEYLIMIFF